LNFPKAPRITNIWSKVVDGENGEWLSKVVIESTRPYSYIARNSGSKVTFTGKGAVVNLPEGKIEVNDGLLREIGIRTDERDFFSVEMLLDHPAEFRLSAEKGLPFRVKIFFDRSPIINLFTGKKVAVDPGHGGRDAGGRGPVSLLEKDIVLLIARNLEKLLHRAGSQVILTREGDIDLSREERFQMAGRAGADVYISIHNLARADSSEEGISTLYSPANRQSALLAGFIQEELLKKLKARNRGTGGQPELAAMGGIPAVETEVLAITNLVEEVFLRGLTVRKKAAEGIFNGLIKYFARNRQDSEGEN